MNKFQCSQEVKDKVKAFEEADRAYKEAWDRFEQAHASEFATLERMREDRNVKLDEARRSLREEAEGIDSMRTTFTEGPFSVQKKWSDYYIPEKLIVMLRDHGLYDSAVNSGILTIKVETGKFEKVKQFLDEMGVYAEFECCEDGIEAGSAVMGPKQVPPFGVELKKE